MKVDPRERLIVALDVPSVAEAEALVARLGETVSFYKIGYALAFAGGIDFACALAGAGKRTFLDLKLHDIGHTVARGVESVARMGATFLTVHAYPQTMKAAVEARAQQAQVLGVDGLVCSPEEAASLHKIVGHQMVLVTPGIRPAGSATGDQKRIMTPARAISAGSDYLVVGRPVLEAADPRAAADAIQAEIAQALR